MEPERNPYEPPSSSISDLQGQPANIGIRILGIFGRGMVYGLCIWTVFAFVYRPYLSQSSTPQSSSDASKADSQQAEQARIYKEQLERTEAMYAESERQQKRMAAIITKQETQLARFDAVLSAWERQAKIKQ